MIKREIPVEFFIKPPNAPPKQQAGNVANVAQAPARAANQQQVARNQFAPNQTGNAAAQNNNTTTNNNASVAKPVNQANVNNFMSYRNSNLSTSSSLPMSDNSSLKKLSSNNSSNNNNNKNSNNNNNTSNNNNNNNQSNNSYGSNNNFSRNGSVDSGSISIASYTSESSEADNLNNYNFNRNYNIVNENKAQNAANMNNLTKNKTYVLTQNGGLGNNQIQLSPVLDDFDDELSDFGARSIRAARLNFPPTNNAKPSYSYNQPPILSDSFLSKEAEQIKKRLDEYVDSASRVLNDINTKTYKRQSEELFNTKFLDEFETTPKYTPSLFRRTEPKERLAEMFIGRIKEEAYDEVPFKNYEDVPIRRIRPRLHYFEPGVTDSPNYKPPQSPNNSLFINKQRYFYENK